MADKKEKEPEPEPSEAPPSYEALSVPPPQSQPQAASQQPGGPGRRLRAPPPLDIPALRILRGRRVILASQSPRRRALLAQVGLTQVETIPSNFAENLPHTLSPWEYVSATATQKALSVYRTSIQDESKPEPALIIAADTIVVSAAGEILEKPRSEAHHIKMLRGLRDTGTHRVYTAVTLIAPLASARDPGYALETGTEETVVKFDSDISDELLLAYVRTREGADKAGGYGIQGTGAILVERIEGSFDNVVGLPLRLTLKLMETVMMKADDDDHLGDEDLLADED
ncbi:septum formation protein Maf [Exophiala spinifera]|uniref:Septum formation protein Maf n=1 Tax=Exophiala spinifera TaxID=91928 RepID=A0A0D2BIA8_9EURO|nr:septum formation protein Maf [Exophiala spinifera]KIW11089.1 septum formation protein Maf [Exophiala spinifera]